MAIVFQRGLVIPVWAAAFCAVALSAPPSVMQSLIVLVGIAVIASTLPAAVRWLRLSRSLVEVLPAAEHDPAPAGIMLSAGTRTRTLEQAISARRLKRDDAADLVRMDDDGGSQMTRQPALTEGSAAKQD